MQDSSLTHPTSVYRYYDRRDLLLYVGITSRGTRRNAEHNGDKVWWPYVARQEIEHFPSRPLAEAREKALIRSFRPPFNVQHNPDSASLQAVYLALEPPRGVKVPGLLAARLGASSRTFEVRDPLVVQFQKKAAAKGVDIAERPGRATVQVVSADRLLIGVPEGIPAWCVSGVLTHKRIPENGMLLPKSFWLKDA